MKKFDLVGNRHIKEAAQRGALGSAVIFDGPAGSGKKAAAAYAAAALLCRADDPQRRPCGVCPSCIQADIGSNPDIIFFNKAGENIKVNDVRTLRMQSFIVPSQSPFKVFIINRADLMNQEAQNALLKVLEEPVSSVFILLTENASSLLQTVRSRCRIYAMEALQPGDIGQWLEEHYAENGKRADKKAISDAAASCGGCIGRAMALVENTATKAMQLADAFVKSLHGSALEVMETCLKASGLSRAEYGDLYTEITRRLVRLAVAEPDRASYYAAVYDYIQKQNDRLVDNNASVFALSSQLAAFCGTLYRR